MIWYIYSIKYYSAIKKNEIVPFYATWIALETITPSEVRRKRTNKISLRWNLINELSYETDSQILKTN